MKVIIVLIFLFSAKILLAELPQIPYECFDYDIYCSHFKLVEKIIDGQKTKVIEATIFVVLSKEDYSIKNIIDLFFNFDSWKEYAESEGSNAIVFQSSMHLGTFERDGHTVHKQYIHSFLKAPAPIFSITFRGVGHFWLTDPVVGATHSGKFNYLDKGYFHIPNEPPLDGAEGYKYHAGEYHLKADKDEVYIYFKAWVIPEINLLPQIAAPYIEQSYLSLLKGMFSL